MVRHIYLWVCFVLVFVYSLAVVTLIVKMVGKNKLQRIYLKYIYICSITKNIVARLKKYRWCKMHFLFYSMAVKGYTNSIRSVFLLYGLI